MQHRPDLPRSSAGLVDDPEPSAEPSVESSTESSPERAVRMRVGLGAGVVLVLVAAAVAVVVSAVSAHPAAASTGSYSAGGGDSGGGSSRSTASSSGATDADAPAGDGSAVGTATTVFVQVVGQVQNPGLYELPAGDRIVDAVAAAGGFTAKADQASQNLAQVLADGQQIVVAVRGAAPAPAEAASAGTGGSAVVDINTADATALETLDGIGPALAERILAYRTAHGGFRSVNDLQNVTGIGPKKFAAIKGSVSS